MRPPRPASSPWVRCWRWSSRAHRIRVNVICPGAIERDISDNTEQRDTDAAKVPAKYPEGTVPLTRGEPGRAEDVADLVVFLASDRSKHITGTPIWIDGGQSLLV